jgi:hypothetical protein
MADYTVTLYTLFLGEQDSDTGKYQKVYSVLSAEVAILANGTIQRTTGMGFYGRHNAEGFTEYEIDIGDVLKDEFSKHYMVVGRKPLVQGNQFVAYALDLEEILDWPHVEGVYGFERAYVAL